VVVIAVSFFAFSYIGVPEGHKGAVKLAKNTAIDFDTWIDINNVRMVTTNKGSISWDLVTGNAGLEYPKGTGKLAIFAAGIWMGGMVGDELRYIQAAYGQEWFMGPITSSSPNDGSFPVTWADGTDQLWQVWKMTKGDGPENPDYAGWVSNAPYGAPLDATGAPLVTGDQTLWTIFNDADPSKHTHGSGSTRPLNIECIETIFAFDKSGALGNTIFVKLDFENKGPDVITDFYASFWSDPDLGDAFNDIVGCDPELGLGFCYNADNVDGVYVGEGACVGYDFFQGVLDDAGNILGMTSFNKYINGTDPRTAQESYNYQQGLTAAGAALIDPTTGNVTKYYCNGDPVTNSGWVDTAPADRRLMCNTGPTTLNPGDKNTIVVGLVLGSGKERLGAISAVRYNDIFAQGAFDTDFEIPPDPPSPNVTIVALSDHFYVSWQDNAEDYTAAGYEFEGYNVYVTNKPAATSKSDWKRVDTFDVVNDVQKIFGITFDEETGLLLEAPIQFGSDAGIKRFIKVTSDVWTGGGYPMVAQKDYYYCVTAYAYNPIGAPLALESVFNELTITPKTALPGTDYGVVAANTVTEATHSSGAGVGEVTITVVNPQLVTGNSYKVTFTDMGGGIVAWNLLSGSTVKLSEQTNFEGDWNYPFVDGLLVKVSGVNSAPTRFADCYHTDESLGSAVLESDVTVTLADGSTETFAAGSARIRHPFRYYFRDTYEAFTPHADPPTAPDIMGQDFEVRCVGPGNGQTATAIDGAMSGWAVLGNHVTQFEVWNIEAEGGPQQINFCWRDRDGNGLINAYKPVSYDRLVIVNTPYDPSGTYTPASQNATWYFSVYEDDGDLADPNFVDDDQWTAGQIRRMEINNPLTAGVDEFTFATTAPIIGDQTVAKDAFFEKIRIVPNPYYGFSLYERTRFQRIMLFTNLPEQCTIRIFDLGGTIIRSIEKDSQDPTYRWDMLTDYQLPLGSGVYIAHITSTYGEKILKFAVFTEQETLETY